MYQCASKFEDMGLTAVRVIPVSHCIPALPLRYSSSDGQTDESIFSQRMSSVVIQTYCSPSGHHFSTSFLLASSCLLAPPLDSCNSNTAGVVRSGSETMH